MRFIILVFAIVLVFCTKCYSVGLKKQNQLNKFIQVEVYVKCISTGQVWCTWLLQFRRIDSFFAFKFGQISLLDYIQSMGVKKQNWLKGFLQVEVDLKCIETKFGGHGFSSFRDFAPFSKWPKFPFETWTIIQSMGVKKQNRLKNIVQVNVDVKCMETKFGGSGFSSFGDIVPFMLAFKTTRISLQTMDYSPWGSKNRIGSKNLYKQRLT